MYGLFPVNVINSPVTSRYVSTSNFYLNGYFVDLGAFQFTRYTYACGPVTLFYYFSFGTRKVRKPGQILAGDGLMAHCRFDPFYNKKCRSLFVDLTNF